jgi:tRNA(Ile)-lysidine synthase TilS/MesJ
VIVEQVSQAVRDSGLFARDRSVVAMLSGGRDSTCLLDVAIALLGARSLCALHVNYGLREAAALPAARSRAPRRAGRAVFCATRQAAASGRRRR